MKQHKTPVLSEQDLNKAYKDALRAIGAARGAISDETRQLMAEAVHEFYHLLQARLEARRSNLVPKAS
jgi:hypothetical protein